MYKGSKASMQLLGGKSWWAVAWWPLPKQGMLARRAATKRLRRSWPRKPPQERAKRAMKEMRSSFLEPAWVG